MPLPGLDLAPLLGVAVIDDLDCVGVGQGRGRLHLACEAPEVLWVTGSFRPDQLVIDPDGFGPVLEVTCQPLWERACPLHRGDGRGRSFSVNLDKNVFYCFDASCGRKGDVIDLWASVTGMSLRQAAMDLVRTFHLEPAPE